VASGEVYAGRMVFHETASQKDALGYDGGLMRRDPEVSWTDKEGKLANKVIARKIVVGAAPDVDLVLTDPAVSRLHAELEPQESGLWVRDLGSRNGTYVEGIRVTAACIPEGGKLRIGDSQLTVHYATNATAVELWPAAQFGPLVGPSVKMRELFARLARVAPSSAAVLIEGETGTGKELAARAVHDASPRGGGPFVIIDCGALPENLLEAELFGHARGAFTGAVEARAGAIEAADGGSAFLDEIGELPLSMQPKLLRVLESRAVRRLGETGYRPVDVRFISATHRDLRTMANNRAFREDLYFRLAVLPVTIPPLRERPGDIVALIRHFLPKDVAGTVTPELLRELVSRPWLGNVRELRNFLERALALGPREALAFVAAPEGATAAPSASTSDARSLHLTEGMLSLPYKEVRERVLNQMEREYVKALLARHDRNVSAAADAAGLNRTYLHRLIRRHEL
jgi:two-component system, NtrC family, response regulator GlrR